MGEAIYVKVSLAAKEGDSSWKVEFLDETPEQLTVEKIISTTHIRWRLDEARRKAHWKKPYELKVVADDGSVSRIRVAFVPPESGLGLPALLLRL